MRILTEMQGTRPLHGRGWLTPVLVGLAVMGFTPYCYPVAYVDYQFRLTGDVPPSVVLPDSVRDGQWALFADDSKRWYRCDGLRPYALRFQQSGHMDVGMAGIYVGLDRQGLPILHVVVRADSARPPDPDDEWASEVAELVTRDFTAKPVIPPDSAVVLGNVSEFKRWCMRSTDGN
ncbi:MAG: hypothetical protein WBC97_11030 [Gemmatimonadales bacterium]